MGKSWMAVMWHKKKHHEFNVEANSKTYSAFRNKLGSAFRSYRKANMTPTRSSALIAMQSATSPTAQATAAECCISRRTTTAIATASTCRLYRHTAVASHRATCSR